MVTNLLAAFAHPDDETIFIGGTLAMLAEKGVHIHLLSATRGEGGEVGEPPLCQPSELGSFRERELRCAAAALGARSLTFLDYSDPRVSNDRELHAFEADLETFISQILVEVKRHRVQGLITHGSNGEYGHPAHKFLHHAVTAASQAEGLWVYTVSAAFEDHPRPRLANQNDPADFILNIEPWFDRKLAAALCHRTQHALFVRRRSEEAGRQLLVEEVLMRRESLHRAYPQRVEQLDDPLARFLQQCCQEVIKIGQSTQGHSESKPIGRENS